MWPAAPRCVVCALLALASVALCSQASAQTVIYVNGGLATGGNSGGSWADAFRGSDALQRGLDAAAPIAASGETAQLWVVAGTYVPTLRTVAAEAGSVTFLLADREELYGGFAGDEASLGERDPAANVTVLSGVLSGASGRAWHVVSAPAVGQACLIDGVTISGGAAYAFGFSGGANGGGIYSPGGSPLVRSCRITGNVADHTGGGGYFGGGTPRLEDCTIDHNVSYEGGGGLYSATFVMLLRCDLTSNLASGPSSGGAVSGECIAQDCRFTGNEADGGGAIAGSSILLNCTFDWNYAEQAPACVAGASIEATGCVFRNNSVFPLLGYEAVFYCYGPGPLLCTDCEFTGNQGGGPAIGDGGDFRSCRFTGNDGDYIDIDSATNCVFTGNLCPIRNGTLVNCTIVNNPGGGVYLHYGGTTVVTNCLLWGNHGSSQLGQIDPHTGTVVLNYSDVQGLTGSLGGVGNFSADPRLDGELRLLSPSPCIDSGDRGAVPPGTTSDGFGQPRFVDDPGMPDTGAGSPPVDVGAFEYQGTTCYANCDGSTAPPVLNAADFSCFLDAFGSGSPYANCDASTVSPRLNVLDFACFLRLFAAGCP